MTKLQDKTVDFAMKRIDKGDAQHDIARALIQQGMIMFGRKAIIATRGPSGERLALGWPEDGHTFDIIAENCPETPVQGDSGVPALVTPDTDVLAFLAERADVARRKGHKDTAALIETLAYDLKQGLHERPIDTARALREFYADCHARNRKAGWWTELGTGKPLKRSVGELFMLMVTEIAEAYDAWERDNAADDKLPDYTGLAVEIGDLQIRLADFAGALAEGHIVHRSDVHNIGEVLFQRVLAIAEQYEAIRKTPEAKGEPEQGDFLPPADVASAVVDKLAFNAERADHKIENRMKEGGKVT